MTPEETVNAFIAHVVAQDLDAAAALCDPDMEYDNVPMGKNLGVEAMKGFLAPMVESLDAVEFVVVRQAAAGNLVFNERIDRFGIGGRWAELPVAGVFELDVEGRIVLWRDYFDMGQMNAELAKLAD